MLSRFVAMSTLAAAAVATLFSAPARAAVLIDDFSQTTATWPVTLVPNQPSGTLTSEDVPNVLFGNRATSLAALVRPNPSLLQPSMAIYTPPGVAHNVIEVDTPSDYDALLTINYNSASSHNFVDLSANPVLDVHVDSYDLPNGQPLLARLFIRDSDNGDFKTGADVPFAATSGEFAIPLSTVPALDPAHIEHLVVQFQPAPGGDLRLASINAVPDIAFIPEPATALLAAPAAILLTLRRRRPST